MSFVLPGHPVMKSELNSLKQVHCRFPPAPLPKLSRIFGHLGLLRADSKSAS